MKLKCIKEFTVHNGIFNITFLKDKEYEIHNDERGKTYLAVGWLQFYFSLDNNKFMKYFEMID